MNFRAFVLDCAGRMTAAATEYSTPGAESDIVADARAARLAFEASGWWFAYRAVFPEASPEEANRWQLRRSMDRLGKAVAELRAILARIDDAPHGVRSDKNLSEMRIARHNVAIAAMQIIHGECTPLQLAEAI